jgi:hypothetical protein
MKFDLPASVLVLEGIEQFFADEGDSPLLSRNDCVTIENYDSYVHRVRAWLGRVDECEEKKQKKNMTISYRNCLNSTAKNCNLTR